METIGDRDALHDELRAMLRARRELPFEADEFLADAFINRLEREIDSRITARTEKRRSPSPFEIVGWMAVGLLALPFLAVGLIVLVALLHWHMLFALLLTALVTWSTTRWMVQRQRQRV